MAVERNRNVKLKDEIPSFVETYIRERMITPTVDEVADHFHASKATIHNNLKKLDQEGILMYRGRIGIPASMFEKGVLRRA